MIETLGFYFAEYWQSIKAWIPVLLTGIVAAAIVWLVIFFTKKVNDRHWTSSPEKLRLAIRIKLRCYEKDIERLSNETDALKKENAELRAKLRTGVEQIQLAGNILGGER